MVEHLKELSEAELIEVYCVAEAKLLRELIKNRRTADDLRRHGVSDDRILNGIRHPNPDLQDVLRRALSVPDGSLREYVRGLRPIIARTLVSDD